MAEQSATDGLDQDTGRVFCVRCAADVSALPPVARYCSRCGSFLPQAFHQRAVPAAPAPPSLALPPPLPFEPPLILLAYARALFNLGWRYERAVGSKRNLDEAARCYWKAARLGDAAARSRFGGANSDGSARPPVQSTPPPPLASVYGPPPP